MYDPSKKVATDRFVPTCIKNQKGKETKKTRLMRIVLKISTLIQNKLVDSTKKIDDFLGMFLTLLAPI